MPKISVITTTYKHQDFIAQTIESILAQTYTDRELLIGDDSPDDATRDIIQSYVSKYPDKIKAWHHSPNKGIVDNLNFLIAQASEESQYIAFLEGDDIFAQHNLQSKITITEKHKYVKMIYNDINLIDEFGTIFSNKYIPNYIYGETLDLNTFVKKDLIYCSYSTLFCDKIALQNIGIRDLGIKGNIISDRDFFGRFANHYKIYGISEALTSYRRHGSGLTGSFQGKKKLLEQLEVCVTGYFQEGLINEKSFNYFLAKKYIWESTNNIFMGNHKEAYKNLRLSMKHGFWIKGYLKLCVVGCLLLPVFMCNFFLKVLFYIFPNFKKRLLGG